MAIVADLFDVVVGVDTHTDTHTAVVCNRLGAVLGEITVPADQGGAVTLLAFAAEHTPPAGRRLWAVDGTRSHGQGLCRILHPAGEDVAEAPKPATGARRRGGKSDTLDAAHAARAVLATEYTTRAVPRADGDREALRILLICRRHHSDARTATVNLLKSLILTSDEQLRTRLRGLGTAQQVTYLSTTHPADNLPTETATRRRELATLAQQINTLNAILRANKAELHTLTAAMCKPLLAHPGVGPVTAAIALTTWSHPGRVRSEAAYAALAGAAPIPASSGRTDRHRLNRGGDRTLNAALHTIAITRRRTHQPTRDYITRRQAQGRTTREINRCLKRYIARQLYRTMQAHHRTT